MISLEVWNSLFIAGTLLFTLIMVGKPRLPALLRYFALASLCLAGFTLTTAALEGDPHGLYAALSTIAFKVLIIPWILAFAARRIHASVRLGFYLRPATTYFLIAGMLVLSAIVTTQLSIMPFVAVALILTGLTLMITRKDLYSQIIGFMTMENGIATFAILSIGGLPILIEMGIFATITIGAIVMAILSHQVQTAYATGDTALLTELTE